MLVSVIVRTKDEAPRLRLVLASLSRQADAEVIVVNDGSRDETRAVLDEAAERLPLRVVHHAQARGRAAASNAGARLATGDVLFFLDGDTLVGPGAVALHTREHEHPTVMARGETYHLRCTRFFADPERGTPQPGQENRVRRLGADLDRHLVTRRQVLERFQEIERRAELGIYPGAGPRQLAELEWEALQHHPDMSVRWMAVPGHNLSVARRAFEAVGGFDERLTINEHRELAFKLAEQGLPVKLVPGARTYHLAHRIGWRDPLAETDWERIFFNAHPCLAVTLMSIFWLSLAGSKAIPRAARILSLPQLEAIVRGGTTIDYDAIRRRHPQLADLSAEC